MRNITETLKEIIYAFFLVCIFSYTASAYEADALDVFEEFASARVNLLCESFNIKAKKNTPITDKLRFNADSEIKISITEPPQKGSVELTSNDGSFVYTPFEGEVGEDAFSFRVSTADEESNIAVCTVTIEDTHENKPSPTSFVYTDMVGHWGEYAAVKMVENDILKGERIGAKYYFYPDKSMTRIDAVNVILSALNADSINVDEANTHIFEDSTSLPDYINNSAYRAHKLGIVDGEEYDGKIYFNPYKSITRAELMKMIDKAMSSKTKSNVKTDFIDFHTIPEWAIQPVKNLIGYGIAEGYEDKTIRPYENVTKVQTVQMVYQMMKYNEQAGVQTLSARIKNGFYKVDAI